MGHSSPTVKLLHEASHAEALQSHLVIDSASWCSNPSLGLPQQSCRMKGGYLGHLFPCCHVQALLSPAVRAVPVDLLELVLESPLWSGCPWREVEVPPARAPKGLQKARLEVAARVGAQLRSWLCSTALVVVFDLAMGHFCTALIPCFGVTPVRRIFPFQDSKAVPSEHYLHDMGTLKAPQPKPSTFLQMLGSQEGCGRVFCSVFAFVSKPQGYQPRGGGAQSCSVQLPIISANPSDVLFFL